MQMLSNALNTIAKNISKKYSLIKYTKSKHVAIHECSLRINHISINYLVANDNVNQVQKAIPLFTIFYFSVRNEEDLARVDEHLNTEKIFNVAMNKLLKIGGSSIYNFTQRALKMLPKEHQPCLELQQELTDMTRKYNAAKEKVAKYKAALQEKKSELEVIRQLNEQLQKKVIDKLKKCQISHSLERNRRLHMMKFHVCTYSPRTTATQNGFI